MNLDKNQHSVYLLNYHLVMVIKYRRKVINHDISNYLKDCFERIGIAYGIIIQEWNHDKDHIHVLFRAKPQTELSKFLNAYKSASSRLVKRDFPVIKNNLWKSAFWSKSYCLITTGGAPLEVIKRYIENQGEK
jgi:putative transposase